MVAATHAGEVKLLGLGKLLTDRYIANAKAFRYQDQNQNQNQNQNLQMLEFQGGAVLMAVTTIAF